MENSHINESILSEEILEDQKKNRIDHMTYLCLLYTSDAADE